MIIKNFKIHLDFKITKDQSIIANKIANQLQQELKTKFLKDRINQLKHFTMIILLEKKNSNNYKIHFVNLRNLYKIEEIMLHQIKFYLTKQLFEQNKFMNISFNRIICKFIRK